jgi:hypothetical protein
MKQGFTVLALALTALAEVLFTARADGQGRGDPQPAAYGWLFSLEQGKAQARQTGKPLMVVLRCVP